MRRRHKGCAAKGTGEIFRVAGPVVTATGLRPRMYDVQFVGEEQLLGEVIQIIGEKTIIQVYEDTSGVKPGEAVMDTGAPLVVELGPGLLGSIYDGVQRPLPVLQKAMGDFILRGLKSPGLTREKTWRFAPKVKQGQPVGPGDVVGTVQEAKNVEHRIMVPPNFRGGKVVQLKEGSFKVDEVVVQLDNGEQVKMHQTWPVRKARPVKERLMPTIPLVTGQRVLDFLFPIAEDYRDMGYNVALMADSTARWAEAMREISSRLEEMPGEEGFPAYLSARLSEFYERAGRAKTLSGLEGSVSVVGAVSPSGGDFSEPVTQGTLRIVKVFWALDTALRARRHFPAINWLQSYSLYTQILEDWFRKNVNEEWPRLRSWTQRTLQEEAELEEIVRLVGADALPPDQQLTLEVARMIREIFLQQNAYHAVDTFCPPERQFKIISAIKKYSDLGQKAVKLDVPTKDVASLKSRELLTRVKYEAEFDKELAKTIAQVVEEFKKLGAA